MDLIVNMVCAVVGIIGTYVVMKAQDAARASEILRPGESMTAADFRRSIIGRGITAYKGKIEMILAICVENGLLIERAPTKEEKISPGVRKMIERPAKPPEQMAFF